MFFFFLFELGIQSLLKHEKVGVRYDEVYNLTSEKLTNKLLNLINLRIG